MIIFYSYKEIIEYILGGNNIYEEERGIKTLSCNILLKKEDIVFLSADKSDGTKTLFVLFKLSRKGNIWSYLTPSENQVNILTEELKDYYKGIDLYNFINKNNQNKT